MPFPTISATSLIPGIWRQSSGIILYVESTEDSYYYRYSLNNGKKALIKFRNTKKGGTLAEKAGLILSVSKTANSIRSNLKKENLSLNASIYTTAVLEFILAEILELSGNECRTDKKKTIKPNHIKKAVESDFELEDLMSALNISL